MKERTNYEKMMNEEEYMPNPERQVFLENFFGFIDSRVTIGKNAVVTAGAVVTKDDCLTGGVPARIIKEIEEQVKERQEVDDMIEKYGL